MRMRRLSGVFLFFKEVTWWSALVGCTSSTCDSSFYASLVPWNHLGLRFRKVGLFQYSLNPAEASSFVKVMNIFQLSQVVDARGGDMLMTKVKERKETATEVPQIGARHSRRGRRIREEKLEEIGNKE